MYLDGGKKKSKSERKAEWKLWRNWLREMKRCGVENPQWSHEKEKIYFEATLWKLYIFIISLCVLCVLNKPKSIIIFLSGKTCINVWELREFEIPF